MDKPKKILLIEDDRHDQYSFIRALSAIENAMVYDIAANGKEALDKLSKAELLPDLIFTDIQMPEMNGMECLKEIVNNPRTKNIPVVMLSSEIEKMEQARDLGAKGFIKKPADCQTLQKRLQQIINLDFTTGNETGSHGFEIAR